MAWKEQINEFLRLMMIDIVRSLHCNRESIRYFEGDFMRIILIFFVMLSFSINAGDIFYKAPEMEYVFWGITKEEGMKDGFEAAQSGCFKLICQADIGDSIYTITKENKIKDINFEINFMECNEFPVKCTTLFYPESELRKLLEQSQIVPSIDSTHETICSNRYAAWYNTVVVNYYIKYKSTISELPQSLKKCTTVYTIDEIDLYSLDEFLENMDKAKQ